MLRVPFKLDPRSLNLRCEILKPTNEKTSTRNTLGRFYSMYKRWFAWIPMGGRDTELADQDMSTSMRRILLMRDDAIESGWAIRYPTVDGKIYQISNIDVFDDADRRYMTAIVGIRNSASVVEID